MHGCSFGQHATWLVTCCLRCRARRFLNLYISSLPLGPVSTTCQISTFQVRFERPSTNYKVRPKDNHINGWLIALINPCINGHYLFYCQRVRAVSYLEVGSAFQSCSFVVFEYRLDGKFCANEGRVAWYPNPPIPPPFSHRLPPTPSSTTQLRQWTNDRSLLSRS